jgi:hypothetical protein
MKALVTIGTMLLMMTGCAMGAGSSITLTAAKSGQNVMLTLRNEFGGPVGYNLCMSGLQRRASGTWEAVQTGDMCTMEIRTLDTGNSATFEKTLPDGLAAGEYRYTNSVESNGSRVVAESNPFNVP